jgi:hypothetical protein
MKLTADTGSDSTDARIKLRSRLSVLPNTQYNAYAFLEIPADLTSVGTNGGAEIYLKEYADNNEDSASIVSHTVCAELTDQQDYNKRTLTNFTTNASTYFIDIEVALYRCAGTLSVGKIVLQDTTTDSETNPAIVGYSMLA